MAHDITYPALGLLVFSPQLALELLLLPLPDLFAACCKHRIKNHDRWRVDCQRLPGRYAGSRASRKMLLASGTWMSGCWRR